MRFDIITIFPEIFRGVFEFGIIRRAVEAGLVGIEIHDLRDYTYDRHRQVDDRPFGGGAGMVMKPEPLFRAVEAITHGADDAARVLLSPQGRLFDQSVAEGFSRKGRVLLICGRYEGVDERVVESLVDEELSIGDYVLSGGEIPAMVIVDAVTRLIPGALGCGESAEQDSFADGLLDYPHYTRPAEYRGMKTPDVLLSGNHAEIERWRRRKALKKTLRCRPDLLREPAEPGPVEILKEIDNDE
ncbi:MAG TPA: tRNA (guanosine(37)-N1)-methyltransferase TrmD [Blastocatellia bacterium]|jgi:tRNA (guanine37-N1)-methyltransferase|nr:tRNA (guanosine(37)-N1)-methyltransferase TrmD [Blastocatellia bacterium]